MVQSPAAAPRHEDRTLYAYPPTGRLFLADLWLFHRRSHQLRCGAVGVGHKERLPQRRGRRPNASVDRTEPGVVFESRCTIRPHCEFTTTHILKFPLSMTDINPFNSRAPSEFSNWRSTSLCPTATSSAHVPRSFCSHCTRPFPVPSSTSV